MTTRVVLRIVAAAVAGVLALSGVARAETTLNVYTAVEAEDLKKYAQRFNQDHPDVRIKWTRDSTGIVTAKLLAEKANPQADVIWGLLGLGFGLEMCGIFLITGRGGLLCGRIRGRG